MAADRVLYLSAAFHNPPKDICHDANNYLAITSIVVAAPLLTAAIQKPYIADYSNRCPLTDVMSLGSCSRALICRRCGALLYSTSAAASSSSQSTV